jgi:hypothetical protein
MQKAYTSRKPLLNLACPERFELPTPLVCRASGNVSIKLNDLWRCPPTEPTYPSQTVVTTNLRMAQYPPEVPRTPSERPCCGRTVLGRGICVQQPARQTRFSRHAGRELAREVDFSGVARPLTAGGNDPNPLNGNMDALVVWIRRDGRWQQLASQMTPIPKPRNWW